MPAILDLLLLLAGYVFIHLWFTNNFSGDGLAWNSIWYKDLASNLLTGSYSLDGEIFHTKLPPGFPLFITALNFLVQDLYFSGQLVVLLSGAAVLSVTWLIAKKVNPSLALIAGAITLLNSIFIVHSHLYLPNVPFTALSLLGLYLFTLISEQRSACGLSLFLLALAVLTRTAGVLLIIPLIVYLIAHKKQIVESQQNILNSFTVFGVLFGGALLGIWLAFSSFKAGAVTGYASEFPSFDLIRAAEFPLALLVHMPVLTLLSLAGAVICYRKEDNSFVIYGTWILVLIGLHMWWWYFNMSYYVQIIPLLSVLQAVAVSTLWKQGSLMRIPLITVLLFGLFYEQWKMFFPTDYNPRYYQIQFLNGYGILKEFSESLELRAEIPCVVPERNVYKQYLKCPGGLLSYQQWEESPPKQYYLFKDNIHFHNPQIAELVTQSGIKKISERKESGRTIQLYLAGETTQ